MYSIRLSSMQVACCRGMSNNSRHVWAPRHLQDMALHRCWQALRDAGKTLFSGGADVPTCHIFERLRTHAVSHCAQETHLAAGLQLLAPWQAPAALRALGGSHWAHC